MIPGAGGQPHTPAARTPNPKGEGMPAPKQPEPQPAPETPPVVPQNEPEWVQNIRALIEELPGKLTATVTDDDRRSIAEQVHGLFEGSGAFLKGKSDDDGDEDETEGDPAKEADKPPEKGDSLARRWFGPH